MSRIRKAEKAAGDFNKRHRVGASLTYHRAPGDEGVVVVTTSAAFVCDAGIAVVFVDGVRGFVAASHLEPKL